MKNGDTVTVFGWHARDGIELWRHSREVTLRLLATDCFFALLAGTVPSEATPAVDVK